MNSLKEIIVEIFITVFIAVAVWFQIPWMWWTIVLCTVLILIIKGYILYTHQLLQSVHHSTTKKKTILYILYFLDIVLLAYAAWWKLVVLWLLIWLLTHVISLKIQK